MLKLQEEIKVQHIKSVHSGLKIFKKGMFKSIPFLISSAVFYILLLPSPLLPFEIPYEVQQFNLAPNIQYLALEKNLSIEEIPQNTGWKKLEKSNVNFGYSSRHYWFRTEITNSSFPSSLFINLNANQLDHVDFYIGNNGSFTHSIAGDDHPFPEWSYPYSSPTVKIHFNEGESKIIYIHVKSESVISFWIRAYREAGFTEMKLKNRYTNWTYIISASVCILFLIYLGRITRDRRFYFLIAIIVNFTFYFMMISGNSYILWPEIPWFQDRLLLLLAAAGLQQIIYFLIRFLQLREISRLLYYVYAALFVMVFPIYLSAIEQTAFLLQWTLIVAFVCYPVFLLTTVYLLFKKGNYVKYLFFLLVIVGSSLFARTLTLAGILPYLDITYDSGPYAFPFILILIVSVLYDKYKAVQIEKENLEKEYNKIFSEINNKINLSKIENLNVESILKKIHSISKSEDFFQINYSLQEMADSIGIRPDQLSEIFSRILNTTFIHFLKILRIHHAKNLIEQNPQKDFSDIAFECGFASKSEFNQAFKEITRLPPSDFKKHSEKPRIQE
ncbi:MAG: helix-turn-helix domain-containing protein [Spirochaetia bacterium]|nr:helix-turn-helix domain-containing protein [Spirochaetia bacterium]